MKLNLKTIQDMLECEVMNQHQDIEITNVAIDSRKMKPNGLYVPLKGEHADGHDYINNAIENGAVATFWNRSIENPPQQIPVILCDDVQIELQRFAHLYRQRLQATIIGVTGSNGKTSVKDVLAAFLSEAGKTQKTQGNYNNELGVPLTLLNFDEDIKYGIVEMGMENLGEIVFLSTMVEPDYAIITNVGNAHLENLGSMENIAKAKWEIVDGLKPQGMVFINGDDAYLMNERKHHHQHVVKTFGKADLHDYFYYDFHQTTQEIIFKSNIFPTVHLPLLGEHQALNAMACLGCCKEMGISFEALNAGIKNIEITGLRNDLSTVGKALLLNDAYKSNPESAHAALALFKSLPNHPKVAILGDMLDLGVNTHQIHQALGASLHTYDIDVLVTYGTLGADIARGAKDQVKEIHSFVDKAALIEFVKPYLAMNSAILVKGSRGMKLEVVIDALKSEGSKNGKN